METTNKETPANTEIVKNDMLICNNKDPLKGNDVAPPLTVGAEYPAIDIITCGCGKKHINVGLKSNYNYVRCYDCNETLPNPEIHWCHPSRFDIKKK